MRVRVSNPAWILMAALFMPMGLASPRGAQQTGAAPAQPAAEPTPRLADGRPDLSGVWWTGGDVGGRGFGGGEATGGRGAFGGEGAAGPSVSQSLPAPRSIATWNRVSTPKPIWPSQSALGVLISETFTSRTTTEPRVISDRWPRREVRATPSMPTPWDVPVCVRLSLRQASGVKVISPLKPVSI